MKAEKKVADVRAEAELLTHNKERPKTMKKLCSG